MFPTLFQIPIPEWLPFIGGAVLPIRTYGVLVATGFLSAISLTAWRAKKTGEDSEKILDLCFWLVVMSIIGARTLFVLTNFSYFSQHPAQIFALWQGGIVFYGGPIAGGIFCLYYVRKHGMNFWNIADIISPSLALGHAIGRLGCFAVGCCYGTRCDLPWAVEFTHTMSLAPKNVHLHPVQIYSSLSVLIIFGILMYLFSRRRFEGQIFATYLLLYSIVRYVLEIFRGDSVRGFIIDGWVSTSQGISIVIFVVTLFFLIRRWRASRVSTV